MPLCAAWRKVQHGGNRHTESILTADEVPCHPENGGGLKGGRTVIVQSDARRSRRFRTLGLFALLGLLPGCGHGSTASDQASQTTEELRNSQSPRAFSISLPAGSDPSSVCVGANGELLVGDGAKISGNTGGFGALTNAGRGITVVGSRAATGSITSRGPIDLLPGSSVNGDVSSSSVVKSIHADISGKVMQRDGALSPPSVVTWSSPQTTRSSGDIRLDHHRNSAAVPGSYGRLEVESGSTLTLQPGVYFFDSIQIDHDATVQFSNSTVLYVASYVSVSGKFKDTLGDAALLLAYSGGAPVDIEGEFVGTLVAPNAALKLRGARQAGSFFARDVDVGEGVEITHAGAVAPPSPCVGEADGTSCSGSAPSGAVCAAGNCINVTCGSSTTSTSNNQTTTVVQNFDGSPVTLTRNTAVPTSGDITTTIDVTKAGAALVRETFELDPNGSQSLVVDLGTSFHGATNITLSTTNGLVSGTIDGRALRPFAQNTTDANAIGFADGTPLPVVTADDGILQQVRSIMTSAGASASQCNAGTTTASAVRPDAVPTSPPVVEGHRSSTGNLKSCTNCEDSCDSSFFGCEGGATAGCLGVGALFDAVVVGFIIGGVCEFGLEIACGQIQESCLATCDNPGQGCCPQACGKQNCCDASGIEFCLEPDQGLCCDADLTACPGSQPSCYSPALAYCLPSGRACAKGIGSCGTDQNAFCCAGTCVDNVCTLGPTFSVSVGITQSNSGPLNFCVSGHGFSPLGQVSVDSGTFPSVSGPQTGFNVGQTEADGNGDFSISTVLNVVPQPCPLPLNPAQVTVTATDLTTKTTTTTTYPGSYFCSNELNATDFNGGCQE